mgnify:CR=1 FL=1
MLDIKTVTGGPLDVNTYVVALDGAAECVLIDPGAEYAVVNGAVCGRKVTAVLLTHAHFDHMLGELQHVERIRKFSLQTNENKSVCDAHTRILEMVLHGTAEELGEALESHLSRYKQSVAQARSVHPEYFTEG